MPTVLPTIEEVANSIDHAILKPNLSRKQINQELDKAHQLNVFSVCVRPSDVAYSADYLHGLNSEVTVGTVIGFPHGATTTAVKIFETKEAALNGATEIDIVANISMIIDGQFSKAAQEIEDITNVARESGITVVKVIFENAYLNLTQIRMFTKALQTTGVDFVKTSTGFAETGAVLDDVKVMYANRGNMEVKASGGIKNLDIYLAFREAGVTRFGTSNADIILEDLQSRLTNGEATGKTGGEY